MTYTYKSFFRMLRIIFCRGCEQYEKTLAFIALPASYEMEYSTFELWHAATTSRSGNVSTTWSTLFRGTEPSAAGSVAASQSSKRQRL